MIKAPQMQCIELKDCSNFELMLDTKQNYFVLCYIAFQKLM